LAQGNAASVGAQITPDSVVWELFLEEGFDHIEN
jgi:hypothetical protein